MKKKSTRQAKPAQISVNQLLVGLLLVLGAVLGTLTITKSQYLGSDASSGKIAMVEETDGPIKPQYGYLWPNTAGPFLKSNEPYPWMTYKSISNLPGSLRFTQINTNPTQSVAYYGKLTEPVLYTDGDNQVGEPQTTAQIYGWTTELCDNNDHGFIFRPIIEQPNGSWIVSGNQLIHFGALSTPNMNCHADPNRPGWNSFWGQGQYIGNMDANIYAGAISYATYNWGSTPAYVEVAKVTLNNPLQAWPPVN